MYNFVVVLQLSVLQLHLNVILKRKVTRGLSMGLNLQHQNFMLESCNYFILYSVLLYSISTLKGIPHLQNDNFCINHSLCYPEIIKKILLFLHAVIVSTESLKCEQSSWTEVGNRTGPRLTRAKLHQNIHLKTPTQPAQHNRSLIHPVACSAPPKLKHCC